MLTQMAAINLEAAERALQVRPFKACTVDGNDYGQSADAGDGACSTLQKSGTP